MSDTHSAVTPAFVDKPSDCGELLAKWSDSMATGQNKGQSDHLLPQEVVGRQQQQHGYADNHQERAALRFTVI